MKGHCRVRELVNLYNPYIFIVLEMHCVFAMAQNLWSSLNFEIYHIVEANGHSGGI